MPTKIQARGQSEGPEPRSRQAGPPAFGLPQPQLSSLLDWELFAGLGAGEGTCPRRRENRAWEWHPGRVPPSPLRTWAGQGQVPGDLFPGTIPSTS